MLNFSLCINFDNCVFKILGGDPENDDLLEDIANNPGDKDKAYDEDMYDLLDK